MSAPAAFVSVVFAMVRGRAADDVLLLPLDLQESIDVLAFMLPPWSKKRVLFDTRDKGNRAYKPVIRSRSNQACHGGKQEEKWLLRETLLHRLRGLER